MTEHQIPAPPRQKTYPTPKRNPLRWSTKRILAIISAIGFFALVGFDMKYFKGIHLLQHVPTVTIMVFAFYFKAKDRENGN